MSYSEWLTLVQIASGLLVAIIVTVGSGVWWLGKQFDYTRQQIDMKLEKLETSIVDKLEYHERHDDERFNQVSKDVWDIRVRNAARDGLQPLVK